MSNIYFTSDTHFGHKNIACEKGSQWKSGWRPYGSLDEMNQDLVKSINTVVQADDTLYHLGDWSFGGIENIWKFRSQIHCQNIHLILGNHDHHIEENKDIDCNGAFRCTEDLFTTVSHYKEVKTSAGVIVLSHYGMRVWHGSHKGWIHLYGHSHGSLPPFGKSMDVGVDVAIREFGFPVPFSLDYISKTMSKREIQLSDHHDPSTNTGKRPK